MPQGEPDLGQLATIHFFRLPGSETWVLSAHWKTETYNYQQESSFINFQLENTIIKRAGCLHEPDQCLFSLQAGCRGRQTAEQGESGEHRRAPQLTHSLLLQPGLCKGNCPHSQDSPPPDNIWKGITHTWLLEVFALFSALTTPLGFTPLSPNHIPYNISMVWFLSFELWAQS